ncbi:MAG: phage holin family protein [Desulfovibrio sp.]|jgi:Na+/H+-dicarboxylate symporter|nr:phage holin family protein [Desulfovibrio sp.]
MDNLRSLIEGILPAFLLGVFGGFARVGRYGIKSLRQLAGCLVVSAFAGVIVHLAIAETSLTSSVQAAVVGVSGYSGGAILDAFVGRIIIGIKHMPGPGAGSVSANEDRNEKD